MSKFNMEIVTGYAIKEISRDRVIEMMNEQFTTLEEFEGRIEVISIDIANKLGVDVSFRDMENQFQIWFTEKGYKFDHINI